MLFLIVIRICCCYCFVPVGAMAPKARGRGGHLQRLAAAGAAQAAPRSSSTLADLLVNEWSWGEISTPAVQRIAAAAVSDFQVAGHVAPTDLTRLASLGGSGLYAGNMHRDLVGRLQPPLLSAAMSQVWCWLNRGFMRCERRACNILLPHVFCCDLQCWC